MSDKSKTLNVSSVFGSVNDERFINYDLKNIALINAEMQLNYSNKTYKVKFHLCKGVNPKLKILNDDSTDFIQFQNDFPFYYDDLGFTWLPIGYAVDSGYKKLSELSSIEKLDHLYKSSLLTVLHTTALQLLFDYFHEKEFGIFITTPQSNHLWEIYYTGIVSANGSFGIDSDNPKPSKSNLSPSKGNNDLYADVKIGTFQGLTSNDAVNSFMDKFNLINAKVEFAENYDVLSYSSIERRQKNHY